MAGITFRGLLGRIEELERARFAKTHVEPYSRLTPAQRENPAITWWVIRKPGVARWEFGQMMLEIFHGADLWSGHRRCGYHSYDARLERDSDCMPYYDSCALEAFREGPFLEWFCEVLAWEPHDGRFWSLIAKGEAIRAWFTPFITPTMCPNWSEGYVAKQLKGKPIPYTLPDGFPLPSVEAVHQKRLEHWECCQRYGTEPTMEETIEYMERRFGDESNFS